MTATGPIRRSAGPLACWLQYEANERADLLAFKPTNRARKSIRQPTPKPPLSILAQYFQALPPPTQQRFLLTITQINIERATFQADMALATSGSVPFLRLDCYRNWFLAQGHADLFEYLRQRTPEPTLGIPK